jgi:hypothetical protein
MPLHDLGSLLPYHSHVDPATSVKALNRMVDDIGQGKVRVGRDYGNFGRKTINYMS